MHLERSSNTPDWGGAWGFRGAQIGVVGMTGCTSGPHLHYAIGLNSTTGYTDPNPYFLDHYVRNQEIYGNPDRTFSGGEWHAPNLLANRTFILSAWWPNGLLQGSINSQFYPPYNVSGYWAGLPPELGPTSCERGDVPGWGGSCTNQERIAGSFDASSGRAYMYMRLYQDGYAEPIRLMIHQGMRMEWHQLNIQTTVTAPDFCLSDDNGRCLRDFLFVDTAGYRTHPSQRPPWCGEYWCWFSVDLNQSAPGGSVFAGQQVIGREIHAFLFAFDYSGPPTSGQYRGILDNLFLDWMGRN
ncbi:MAG: hypothetical protein U0556_08235 [Dehalococcoidia bacterium]